MNHFLPSAVLLLALAAVADVSARSSDRNQPLTADADRNDCIIEDNAPCVLIGNVHIRQGTLNIHAERADLRLARGEVRRVTLTGTPVQMTQETDNGDPLNAAASQADYDLGTDVVVLTGNASVQQPGRSLIAGELITYNMRTGQVQGGGAGNGRVRLQFEPRPLETGPAPANGNPH